MFNLKGPFVQLEKWKAPIRKMNISGVDVKDLNNHAIRIAYLMLYLLQNEL